MTQQIIQAVDEEGKVVCGQVGLAYGRLKTTSRMLRTGVEDWMKPAPNGNPRCKKCSCALGVEVPRVPVMTKESHFKVPFNRRHEAKSAGLWWNNETKTWFSPRKHFINGGPFGYMTNYLHGEEVPVEKIINWNESGAWE